MRFLCCRAVLLFVILAGFDAAAADGRITKVLPQFLDAQGRHALSPSLFERDAYQAELRKHPDRISALQFNIHWKAARPTGSHPVLRIEVRTSRHAGPDVLVLESPLPGKATGGWTPLTLDAEAYRAAGDIQAWRATIRDGTRVIAESKSFLW